MADYTVSLGRLTVPTVLDDLKEQFGDGLDAVGGTLVAPDAKPRPLTLTVPVAGAPGRTDWYEAGLRIRRQVRGLLENPAARMQGLYFRWDIDPESNGWLLVGGGDLEEGNGGVTFADWKLTLTDCYRVGSLRTHRPARRAALYDRRSANVAKDTLRRVYGAVFPSLAPLPLIYLPVGADDVTGYGGRRPTLGYNSALLDPSTMAPVVTDAQAGEVFSYERPEARFGVGDVVVRNRNGAGALTVAGHSIASGYGLASPSTGCYGALVDVLWGRVPYRNFAVGGALAALDENTARPGTLTGVPGNGYVKFLQTIKRAAWPNTTYAPNPMGDRAAAVLGFGFNDLYHISNSGGTTVPMVEALRTMAYRHRSSVVCEHTDATIGYGAGWTTVTSTLYNSGPGYRTRTASGGTVTLTIPSSFRGGRLCVVYVLKGGDAASVVCSEGATLATHVLDGTAQAATTISSQIAVTRTIDGLAPGAHTITLTFNSVSGSPGFNCYSVEAPDPPKVIVPNIARLPDANWLIGLASDATVAAWNTAMRAFCAGGEFADGNVVYWDVDAVVGKRADLTQADLLHPNDAGHAVYAAELARVLSPEEILGPDQPLTVDDVPSVENARVRVRFDTTGAAAPGNVPMGTGPVCGGFAIDVNANLGAPQWTELGKVHVQRATFWNVDDVVSVSIDECSPERATIRVVMRAPMSATSRETVFVTLARGWAGPRIECYPSSDPGGYPSVALSLAFPWLGAPDSAAIVQASDAGSILSTAGPGGALSGLFPAFGNLDGENVLMTHHAGFVAAQAAFASVTQPALAGVGSDTSAYGATVSQAGIVTVTEPHCGMFVGHQLTLTDLFMEAETMALGAGTTNTAVAGSSGSNAARGTRTSDANAHATKANWPAGRMGRYRVFARVKTSASTLSVYAKSTGAGGTTGPTKTTTSTGYVWVDLGEVQVGNSAATLEIHAWSAAAATFDVDCVQAFKLEDRTMLTPTYDGARDLGRSVLYQAAAVPALVARGGSL